MGLFSRKTQLINFYISIACSIMLIIDIITKWWTHQDINNYAGYLIFNDGSNKSAIINKLMDLRDAIGFFFVGFLVLTILFTFVSFIGVGMGGVKARTNLIIIGLYAVILGIYIFFSKPMLLVNMDYKNHKSDREKIVSMVENGQLGNPKVVDEVVDLPEQYKDLSLQSGKIEINRENGHLRVYFNTYRGILCNDRSVIAYSPTDDETLHTESTGFVDDSKKYDNSWFWGVINK